MKKFVTQIKLMLVVFGEYFSPYEISQLLKIDPTDSWVKGDIIPTREGLIRNDDVIRFRQETVWEFSTGFIETLDFEDVSNLFVKEFRGRLSNLKAYIEKNKLEVSINIVVEIADEEKPSIHLDKRIVEICNELGAEIDIDMYLLSND